MLGTELTILRPPQKLARTITGKHDIWSRVPSPKPSGPEGVVSEQKIVYRVLFAARQSELVRIGPRPHTPLMRLLPSQPVRLGEGDLFNGRTEG